MIREELELCNIRSRLDLRNEKLNYKIRELSLQKIPFIAVVGEKEIEQQSVMLRELGSNNQVLLKTEEFLKKIKNSCRIE